MGKTYVGVGSKAQEVKKIYVGVNGIARQVKRAYVGVNGVARLIYEFNTMPNPLYLIQNGISINEEYSGGWQGRAQKLINTSGSATTPSVGHINDYMYSGISIATGNLMEGIVEIKHDIDMNSFNKIIIEKQSVYNKNNSIGEYLAVINRANNSLINYIDIRDTTKDHKKTFELDISSIDGKKDICIILASNPNQSKYVNIRIYNLWLE